MNGVANTATEHAPVDQKIDPSIATAITTGEHPSQGANGDSVPGYTANAPQDVPSSGPTQAAPEKSGLQHAGSLSGPGSGSAMASHGAGGSGSEAMPPTTSTTTTTIIHPDGSTTTTGPQDSSMTGAGAGQMTASPTSAASPTAGANDVAPSAMANGQPGAMAGAEEKKNSDALPAAAAGAGAGAVGAGGAAAAANHGKQDTTAADSATGGQPISSKEAKKYQKLLAKEEKSDEKDMSRAVKDASSLEKPLRKARKAEAQSAKRHRKAVDKEHKASKAFNKAKAELEKRQSDLQKAMDELDIKKRHTTSTNDEYEKAKKNIDAMQARKVAHDQDRARRQASLNSAPRK